MDTPLAFHPDAEAPVRVVDIVNLKMPLYPSTEHFFNDATFTKMKRDAYLVNTARGKPVERGAVLGVLESGHRAGYAGDGWFPQPVPKDHPWRTMPWNGMTPHISGTSLAAQARYAADMSEILESDFDKMPIRNEYLIVDGGALAGTGAKSL
ncbi:MAG: NAD(P)-dependent oxidoreductase [Acetobacteraceae bacterium]